MSRLRRWGAIALLVTLSPILAEYLQAYDESTGQPLVLLGGLIVLVPLYGAPALLIRELARRRGLDWRGLALLATALGFVQAGLIDQSLFIERYRDLGLLQEWFRATEVPALGLSAFLTLNYVGGHVLYSFLAPIALTEGVVQDQRPWVGRVGLVVALLGWIGAAVLVGVDNASMNDESASTAQLAATVVLVLGLVALALRCRATGPVREPSARLQIGVGLVAGLVYTLVYPNWWGTALEVVGLAAVAVLVVRWARASSLAGLFLGLLLPRVLLAFGDEPLFGEATMARQVGHHVAMLVIVLVVSGVALRRRSTPRQSVESSGA